MNIIFIERMSQREGMDRGREAEREWKKCRELGKRENDLVRNVGWK